MCFQAVDFARLRPVRYTEMNHPVYGLCQCVRSPGWLSLNGERCIKLYSQLTVPSCHHPRADSDGAVYVPGYRYIAVLEITDSGNLGNFSSLWGQS